MRPTFKSLFHGRTKSNAAKRDRRARISIESLDRRLVPATYPMLDAAGTLYLIGDAANDIVRVRTNFDRLEVIDGATLRATLPISAVRRVEFYGDAGNDVFRNDTGIPSIARGGPGDDVLIGGYGDDTLIDGQGRNYLEGGPGLNTIAGIDVRNAYDKSRLSASGRLAAAIEDIGGGRQLLTISGPSGYGLQLVGVFSSDGAPAETFRSVGNPILKTAAGDIPLPGPITVSTLPDATPNVGVVAGTSWSQIDLTAPLNQVRNATGLTMNPPAVAGWGVKLGKELKGIVPGPWNDAVPYLYATTTSPFSFTTGSISGGVSVAPKTAVVFDPADPFLYVGAEDVAVAYSENGRIPFTPKTRPADMTADFFGHVAVKGAYGLTKSLNLPGRVGQAVPFKIDGEVVVNLDASSGRRRASDVFTNGTAINDVGLAANLRGGAALTAGVAGISADLKIDLVGATLVYDPARSVFLARASLANPLAGVAALKNTPLAFLPNVRTDVDATIRGDGRFHVGVTATGTGFDFDVDVSEGGIDATTYAQVDLGSIGKPSLLFTGRLENSGAFRFEATAPGLNVFGVTADWIVVWTRDGVTLSNGAKDVGGYVQYYLVNGFLRAEERWFDGRKWLEKTWDTAGGLVVQSWGDQGVYVVTKFQAGVKTAYNAYVNGKSAVEETYANGKLTLRRAWDAAGKSTLETWDAVGGRVWSEFDNLGRIIHQATYSNGALQFRRTWNYLTGEHFLEIYQGGVLSSKQLWSLASGSFVREVRKIAEYWEKFVGLF